MQIKRFLLFSISALFCLAAVGQGKPATTGLTSDQSYNGMGKVALEKNMVNNVNTLTQAMFEDSKGNPLTNTIFVVQYDYELGEDIKIPAGCVLEFDGGSIKNNNILFGEGSYIISNGKIENTTIICNQCTLSLSNCEFSNTSKDNVIEGVVNSLTCNNCKIHSNSKHAICLGDEDINSFQHVYLNNLQITGNYTEYCIRLISKRDGSLGIAELNNCTILINDKAPYSIINFNHVSVIGGEFSSSHTENSGPLIYRAWSAQIIGGYYHDMYRGATIGGQIGKFAIITNTVNKNMSSKGISIDWAQGTTQETYSDGYGIISGNIIENALFGMFIQGKNINITNNIIKGGTYSENAEYGVRINAVDSSEDDTILFTDNIVDYSGYNVRALFLGDNTHVNLAKNIIKTGSDYLASGNNSAEFSGYGIKRVYGNDIFDPNIINMIIVDESVNSGIDLKANIINSSEKIRNKYIIIDNRSTTAQCFIGSRTSCSIYGTNRIYPGKVAILNIVSNNVFKVNIIEDVGYGASNQRPTNVEEGYRYWDTGLHKPIWWNGTAWIDATGAQCQGVQATDIK